MRIFVARLAGTPVFDPAGDQLGRIRDVVVSMRPAAPPRVHGLVVEVQPRRRVFLPITRVRGVEADAVIFTGAINMRRFEKHATESLALGELLDLTVEVGGEKVIVLDLAMEQVRSGEWLITKVAVLRGVAGRGLRRRRGETLIVDWADVKGFGAVQDDQGAAGLLAAFEETRPADLANALRHLPDKRRAEVASALEDDRLADVLEELPERDQIGILGRLDAERASDVLAAMDPDDAADLLQDLPPAQAQALLSRMEPREAAPVLRLLTYAENTAGGMMTSVPIVLPPHATIAEALAQVRRQEFTPAVAAQVYVARPPIETPTGRYLGVAHFQRLLRDPPSALLGTAVDNSVDPIRPDMPLREVTSYLAFYNLVAVAVVDELGRLLGAVTVDDVLDHLLPADWRERDERTPEVDGGER
ncbi:magnesium transporter [Sphaerisporangium krabiense]|uniref:Flagellar motility protein MotE (MotC chaperone)/sporulation protein YlmC with PRC-barrel domain n=1 Tax=Sphaerisporangium krabiense TaxID=763782 RepID=A0A7W9DQY3_9ACTN|nr:CBS domain-containing protein [Sphaerisporangium krabiense]MBB5627534.1 flagellar motility protein MotE (MotC chaperone)/sporulation protein YlmC with PRC-barrel domain [Sphaerisporangium krabiense]GII66549.1 magnesium transporter [Sphaerisporangium krabiense]